MEFTKGNFTYHYMTEYYYNPYIPPVICAPASDVIFEPFNPLNPSLGERVTYHYKI